MASSCICKRLWDTYKVSHLSQRSGPWFKKHGPRKKALINKKHPLILCGCFCQTPPTLRNIWDLLSEFFLSATVSISQRRVRTSLLRRSAQVCFRLLLKKTVWLKAMKSFMTHVWAAAKSHRAAERCVCLSGIWTHFLKLLSRIWLKLLQHLLYYSGLIVSWRQSIFKYNHWARFYSFLKDITQINVVKTVQWSNHLQTQSAPTKTK